MKRRNFLSGVAATSAWPAGALAQASRRPVIGCLFHFNPEPSLTQFRAALARLGYRDGETIDLDLRLASGSDARLAEFAGDLVARRVAVIVTFTTPPAIAAKLATNTIPIVALAADPVGSGLIENPNRPSGNVTGISLAVKHVSGKLLGLMREATPSSRRIGLLVNSGDPFSRQLIEGVDEVNLGLKLDLQLFRIANSNELEAVFEQMTADKIDAAIIQPTLPRSRTISLALRHRLPTGQPWSGYATEGGLLSYSAKPDDVVAGAAAQVDQILKGVRIADIPMRQPTKFEMGLNLKTANALGLTVPPMLLAQADEIIE